MVSIYLQQQLGAIINFDRKGVLGEGVQIIKTPWPLTQPGCLNVTRPNLESCNSTFLSNSLGANSCNLKETRK